MTPEQALTFITIIGTVGTVANVWITLTIQKNILGLKLWVRENFVAKEDMPNFLQGAESLARLKRP